MKFYTRKMVAAKDLNSNGSLFGGRLLAWIDEEAFIFSACQLKDDSVVTRYISNIEFLSTARIGDIVEIGMEVVDMGRTSITLACLVRKKGTDTIITQIDKIVFVLVGRDGKPKPHYQNFRVRSEAV
ncbi:acyl-CoA thioesterase [Alphaproteobacteria bacterium]|jgi:acyl-CoA thioesterase YciA|nr:acyl-CoA thioesterase [Alphaproteobacteria bacterium]